MKNTLQKIMFGKDKRFNGILAMLVVGAIALGCTCLKDLNKSQTSTPTNQGTSPQNPTPTKQTGTIPTNSNGELPTDADLEAIVQETLQDFTTGVSDSDFSTLYDKSSKGFKKTYTLDTIRTSFISFINQKARLVPILRSTASMTPSYVGKPTVGNVKGFKTLTANGSYSTSPGTSFELQYWLEDRRWKLIGMRVRMQ